MSLLQLMCPRKMYMLRGNHELRRVNGWEAWYKEGCFLAQCKKQFGAELGATVWEEVNLAFDAMPLAAVVDDKVRVLLTRITRAVHHHRKYTHLDYV